MSGQNKIDSTLVTHEGADARQYYLSKLLLAPKSEKNFALGLRLPPFWYEAAEVDRFKRAAQEGKTASPRPFAERPVIVVPPSATRLGIATIVAEILADGTTNSPQKLQTFAGVKIDIGTFDRAASLEDLAKQHLEVISLRLLPAARDTIGRSLDIDRFFIDNALELGLSKKEQVTALQAYGDEFLLLNQTLVSTPPPNALLKERDACKSQKREDALIRAWVVATKLSADLKDAGVWMDTIIDKLLPPESNLKNDHQVL